MAAKAPKAPGGLGTAGRKLWRAIVADVPPGFQLDSRELHLLASACRCADELELLDATVDRDGPLTVGSQGQKRIHPALPEARALRLTQLRLLHELRLDPPEAEAPGVRQARKAADARWQRRRENVQLRSVAS